MWLPGHSRIRHFAPFLLAVAVLALGQGAVAQAEKLTPQELVRETIRHEITSDTDRTQSYMFRSRKETARGSQTKLMVETRDAMAGMLVAINDQPLTPEQRQAEAAHLQYISSHPEEIARKQRQEKDDADRVARILRAMPDAFLYEPDGTEQGKEGVGKPGEELVRLKFRPNPKYNPPTRVEQVLTGMQGVIRIDARHQRLANIDGTLFRDVGFGWGILGHLDRGGHFQVEQGTLDDEHWTMSRISLEFTGKILLFRNIAFKSTETFSDFHPVSPNLTFAQGASLLQQQSEAREHNGGK